MLSSITFSFSFFSLFQKMNVRGSKPFLFFSDKITKEPEEPTSNFKLNLPPPKNDSKEAQTSENKSKLNLPWPKNNGDDVVADNNGDNDGNSFKISNNYDKEAAPVRDDKSPPKKMLKRRNIDLYATKDEEDE